MQRIGKLLEQPSSGQSGGNRSATDGPARPRLSQEAVDGIFTFLDGAYGRRFSAQFVDATQVATHKATWARMLAGLSPEHIERGLDEIAARTPEWPPNAVDFRRLCLGLLDRGDTIRRVRELKPGDDPVAREILGRLTSWEKSHGSHDDLERAAREHYTDAVAAVEHEQLALPAPNDAA